MTSCDPMQRLQAQLGHLRSDERRRRRAALVADMTPEEGLAAAFALCRWAAFLIDRLSDEERARALARREPVPEHAAPVLRRLAGRGQASPVERSNR